MLGCTAQVSFIRNTIALELQHKHLKAKDSPVAAIALSAVERKAKAFNERLALIEKELLDLSADWCHYTGMKMPEQWIDRANRIRESTFFNGNSGKHLLGTDGDEHF